MAGYVQKRRNCGFGGRQSEMVFTPCSYFYSLSSPSSLQISKPAPLSASPHRSPFSSHTVHRALRRLLLPLLPLQPQKPQKPQIARIVLRSASSHRLRAAAHATRTAASTRAAPIASKAVAAVLGAFGRVFERFRLLVGKPASSEPQRHSGTRQAAESLARQSRAYPLATELLPNFHLEESEEEMNARGQLMQLAHRHGWAVTEVEAEDDGRPGLRLQMRQHILVAYDDGGDPGPNVSRAPKKQALHRAALLLLERPEVASELSMLTSSCGPEVGHVDYFCNNTNRSSRFISWIEFWNYIDGELVWLGFVFG